MQSLYGRLNSEFSKMCTLRRVYIRTKERMGYDMRKFKINKIALMLSTLIFFGMSGCGSGQGDTSVRTTASTQTTTTAASTQEESNVTDDPITGGRTYDKDPSAPNEIKSKDIVEFEINMFLDLRWDKNENHQFEFSISDDGSGNLIVSESVLGISCEADEDILKAIQDIIDEYSLVSKNGVYDTTAGLPPEFAPRTLKVKYESGEELKFTEDNDPGAEWEESLYDAFAEWFSGKGINDLYPEEEIAKVSKIEFKYIKDGKNIWISNTNVLEEDAIDGEKELLELEIYYDDNDSEVETFYSKVPEDYYDRITEIIADSDFITDYRFKKIKEDAEFFQGIFTLYLEFEDDSRISFDTYDEESVERESALIEQLLDYYGNIFEQQLVE